MFRQQHGNLVFLLLSYLAPNNAYAQNAPIKFTVENTIYKLCAEPVRTGGINTNVMDAALGKLDNNGRRPFLIHGIGAVSGAAANPVYSAPVKKHGFETKLTDGVLVV